METGFQIQNIISEIKKDIAYQNISVTKQYLASSYYERMMAEFKEQKKIIIVGSGVYGLRLFEMLEAEGVSSAVKCFCDNSEERQELKIRNLKVLPVNEAVLAYPDAYYIITPKKYENELLRQLVSLGIPVNRIAIYIFAHTGLVD